MGLFKNLVMNRTYTMDDFDRDVRSRIYDNSVGSGAFVNEESAKRFSAVYACVRVLSETLASMPIILYRENSPGDKSKGKCRATDHPLYDILKNAVNEEMPAYLFKETMMEHCTSSGNAYAQIRRNRKNEIEGLYILPWDSTEVRRNTNTMQIEYVTNDRGKEIILPFSDVFHVAGLGYDGLKGYSPIRMAMEAVGLGLAAEKFAAAFYGNGTHIGGILKHPGKLSQQGHDNLKRDFENRYKGLSNAHSIPILEEGMEFIQLGMKPDEAQFIETRRFQIEEIARIYRVPLHMLQDLERATNNNIEHQSLEFVMYTMLPWFTRWEQFIDFKLLTKEERRQGYHAEFLLNALLRGDIRARAEFYNWMRQNGIMNADEIRELENMNPQEGECGKVFFVNGNMISAEKAAAQVWGGDKNSKE